MALEDLVDGAKTLIKDAGIDPTKIFPELVTEAELKASIKKYVNDVVAETMARRQVHKTYRTYLPDAVQAFRFHRKDLIDRGQLNTVWAQAGIEGEVDTGPRKDWCDIVFADMFEVTPLNMLINLFENWEPDDTWTKAVLASLLYDDQDVDKLVDGLAIRAAGSFRDNFIDACFDNLRAGLLPEASWEDIANTAKLGWVQSEFLEEWLTLEDKRARVQLRKDIEQERLRQDLITPEEYVTRVQAVGVDAVIANGEAELIMAQRGEVWAPPP